MHHRNSSNCTASTSRRTAHNGRGEEATKTKYTANRIVSVSCCTTCIPNGVNDDLRVTAAAFTIAVLERDKIV